MFILNLQPEHPLAAWLRTRLVFPSDVATIMEVCDVGPEVPELLGADVAHLLGLLFVHNLDWYLFSKMFKV